MDRLSYQEAVSFHGHDGPFLALGYRAGEHALQRLRPGGIMDIDCQVETLHSKPYMCVMDGIQCATPCTVGKGTLKLAETSGRDLKITFRNRETDEAMLLTLRPDIMDRALRADDLHKEAEWIRSRPVESLFEVESRQHRTTG